MTRHLPRRTLRLKLACNDRTDLRMTIGIAGDMDAATAEHEFAPEAFNGWPLFGRGGNAGHVPMAGPDDHTPLEVGIDLTSLLKDLGPDQDGKGRRLHESKVDIEDGNFGKSLLEIETIIGDLERK